MGLDAYMISYTGKNKKPVDFSHDKETNEEVHYWRKHPNLERWMSELYFEKGGKGTIDGVGGLGDYRTFNCCKVQLTEDDLESLQEAVKRNLLPPGGGFFHGNNSDEHYRKETLEAIERAKKEIKNKRRIYYTSWW